MARNVEEVLRQGTLLLRDAGIERARVEAEILLAHVLNATRLDLLAHPDRELTPVAEAAFNELTVRRASRYPLPYLTGVREFMGLRFHVNPHVLIPRPETEVLVEAAIEVLRSSAAPSAADHGAAHHQCALAVDVGTGSGAIAVSLAHYVPKAHVLATDLSHEACTTARLNAQRLGVADRVEVCQGDLLAPLADRCGPAVPPAGRAAVVCANLPYIPDECWSNLQPEVHDWEPEVALRGGPGGLQVIFRFLEQAPGFTRPGGRLFLEIGPEADQAARVAARLRTDGCWDDVAVLHDLAGLARVVTARRR